MRRNYAQVHVDIVVDQKMKEQKQIKAKRHLRSHEVVCFATPASVITYLCSASYEDWARDVNPHVCFEV